MDLGKYYFISFFLIIKKNQSLFNQKNKKILENYTL